MKHILIICYLCLFFCGILKADLLVYGCGETARNVKYEPGIDVLTLSKKLDVKKMLNCNMSIILRDKTLYVINLNPRYYSDFVLNDGDIVLFSDDARMIHFAVSDSLPTMTSGNGFPIYAASLPRMLQHYRAKNMLLEQQNSKETLLFIQKMADSCARIDKSSTIALVQMIKQKLDLLFDDYELTMVTPLCARLLHRKTGEIICYLSINSQLLSFPCSYQVINPPDKLNRIFCEALLNMNNDENDYQSLCLPADEIDIPVLNYIAMRLYLHDKEQITYAAAMASKRCFIVIVQSINGNAIYKITENQVFRLKSNVNRESVHQFISI